jgi:hypothetical protein
LRGGASASFLSLPWELLQDPRDELPLALQLPAIDRCLSREVDTSAEQNTDVLRILVVIARPSGLHDVSYGIIARPLFRRVAAMNSVHMLVLRPPTFSALQQRLAQAAAQGEPFHVLHFDGRGQFLRNSDIRDPNDPRGSESTGALIFEHAAGGRRARRSCPFLARLAAPSTETQHSEKPLWYCRCW